MKRMRSVSGLRQSDSLGLRFIRFAVFDPTSRLLQLAGPEAAGVDAQNER